jgi:hypothetical protein
MNKKAFIGEALDEPGFWILGGVGSAMAIIGWIGSKKMGWETLPFWQLLIMVIVILLASAFFSTRE